MLTGTFRLHLGVVGVHDMSISDQVSRLALDPSVRRAVQRLPQHQLANIDDRFNDLLARLSLAESVIPAAMTTGQERVNLA